MAPLPGLLHGRGERWRARPRAGAARNDAPARPTSDGRAGGHCAARRAHGACDAACGERPRPPPRPRHTLRPPHPSSPSIARRRRGRPQSGAGPPCGLVPRGRRPGARPGPAGQVFRAAGKEERRGVGGGRVVVGRAARARSLARLTAHAPLSLIFRSWKRSSSTGGAPSPTTSAPACATSSPT